MINISKEAIVQEFQKLNIPAEKVAEGVASVLSGIDIDVVEAFVLDGINTTGYTAYLGPKNGFDEDFPLVERQGQTYEKHHVDCLAFVISENKICFASHEFDSFQNIDEWHSDDYFCENDSFRSLAIENVLSEYRF